MPGQKFLVHQNGGLAEAAAIQVSAGAADAGKIPGTGADGRLDITFMPPGVAPDVQVLVASEALSAGDLVNIWSNAGVFSVRKADASTSGKEAHGFVLAAVASGANASVYFDSTNTQMSGLAPGVQYLSATTPGKTQAAAPSGSGQVVQRVGYAVSATAMNADFDTPIKLA